MPPTEKEKSQKFQDKYQAILSGLLKEDDNKYCADCDAKGPRWASWNLGLFICIRCAGIHRNLGVHISRVKSVNLDQWTAEQIASMQSIGNAKSRSVYESNIPETFRRSQNDSAMEQFIRSKYEQKKWIAKEWTQPKITISSELKEDDSSSAKRKSKSTGINLDSSFTSMKLDAGSSKPKKSPSKPLSSPTPPPPSVVKKNEPSLLDLEPNDVFSSSNGTFQGQSDNQLDLFNLGPVVEATSQQTNDSLFQTDFLNNMPETNTVDSLANNVETISMPKTESCDLSDLMSGSVSNAPKAMDKNSILALYGQANKTPTQTNLPQANKNMFAGNSGNFANNSHAGSPGSQNNLLSNNMNGNFGMPATNNNRSAPQLAPAQQQQAPNFGMNQMNMFGKNPYNQPKMNNSPAPSTSSLDLFEAFSTQTNNNTFSTNSNSAQTAVPNIGNTLLTDLWQ